MRLFIPSYNRADAIVSHMVFSSFDCFIVVHNDAEWKRYISNPTVSRDRVIVSGADTDEFGLTRQRQWIVDNLVDAGEWFVFADDDIRKLCALPLPWYDHEDYTYVYKLYPETNKNRKYSKVWADRFKDEPSPEYFRDIVYGMAHRADEIGARACGFSSTDNYFFRSVHWSTVHVIRGGLQIIKNVGMQYDHNITMEDYNYTAEQLFRFGKVLVNNFVHPLWGTYRVGGMGTLEERTPARIRDCKRMMEKWPGLFRYKNLKHHPRDSDVALKLHSEKQISKWRASLRRPIPEQGYVFPLEA